MTDSSETLTVGKDLAATEVKDAAITPVSSDSHPLSLNHKLRKDNDIALQVDLEHEDEDHDNHSLNTLDLAETKNLVTFQPGDPGNPHNWSQKYRAFVTGSTILIVLNSVLGSSLPSGYEDVIARHFNVTNNEQLVLPISVWLMGYVVGPIVFGPLSERYGRQVVMFATFAVFSIFNIAINFSPNFASLVVFRFIMGVMGSSPISVGGGVMADLYSNPVHRGRSMALFMLATGWGAVVAPIATGYLGVYGWRWPTIFQAIFTGISWIPLAFLPETYAPVILLRRAKKIRKEHPGSNATAPIELEKSDLQSIMTVVLARPLKMLFTEWLVALSCLYLALVYAIYYMFFQVYPLIYNGIYSFSMGEMGLTFLAIGVGSLMSMVFYLYFDKYYHDAVVRGAAWTKREEYRRLPLACIAAPFLTIGMFWIGWTARPSVHWIVPTLGGIPFGFGFLLIFMGLTNYIVDAYDIFAASGLAASSCSRSLFAAVLPFVAGPMFDRLGIAGACSLLGGLSILTGLIPFLFIRYGDKIRANSKFCQELAEQKRRLQEEDEARKRRREARERKAARTGGTTAIVDDEKNLEEVDR